MAKEFTSDNFKEEVENSDKLVLVDFWAEWCGPCKMIGPIITMMSNERDDMVIGKVNVDDPDTAALSAKYNIRTIPTLIFFKDGKEVERVQGFKSLHELNAIANGLL